MQSKSWFMFLLMVMAAIAPANSQSASEIDAIKAAHEAFYTALSARDAKAGPTSLTSLISGHPVKQSLLATKTRYRNIG